MEELLAQMGISERTIKQMEEICPNIREMGEKELIEKIEILKQIECDEIQIRNIISSNAIYLDRSKTDIEKLIKEMKELGFRTLNILFEENPYILNLDAYEIEKYVKDRENKGEKIEEIVEEMSSNPIVFDEIWTLKQVRKEKEEHFEKISFN